MHKIKMKLPSLIYNLEERSKIKLAIELIEIGLPIWVDYTSKNKIEYIDSVVGMHHKVSRTLIPKAIQLFKTHLNDNFFLLSKYNHIQLKILSKKYLEPRVALIDEDFELPKNVELIFLSSYYLIEFLIRERKSYWNENNICESINHSIKSIIDSRLKSSLDIELIINNYI